MLRKDDQDHSFAFICEKNGAISELLSDTKGFFIEQDEMSPRIEMDPPSRANYQQFIKNAELSGFALCENIGFIRQDAIYVFSLFGIYKQEHLFVIAVQSPQHLFVLYEEFMRMINEQARSLRNAQKETALAKERQVAGENVQLLEEYMQLNNELANMQRELTIKNKLLQDQEKRFRELVTFNPDAQMVLACDKRILFLNPAAQKLLEVPVDDIVGSECRLNFEQQDEIGIPVNEKFIWLEVRKTDITWEGEQALLVSLRDITERKQIEQVKDDVQRITQHDLISPLNPVINLPGLLLEDDNLRKDQKEILEMISKAGNRVLRMIRLSINLYKMEQGTFTYTAGPVDMVATFKDILGDQSSHIRARNVRIDLLKNGELILPGDEFVVSGEITLCYSLFSNLVLNSLEASEENGVVNIDMRDNGKAFVSIHNSKPVPSEIQPRFFEKYITAGKKEGTGLGTYSARLIALTLGGDIRMESSEQTGTTVTVELPLSTEMSDDEWRTYKHIRV